MLRRIYSRDTSFACLVLIVALVARGLFMEFHDLIDPTESRYAIVAQEMVISHNWLTPQLPMPEGIVPYLGKPPLHFWITAISYKLFGFEEWSSRLPSLLDTVGILAIIFSFCSLYFGRREAIAACTIALSSAMFFFLAGASVTDVTLTALVTAAAFFLYRFVNCEQAGARKHIYSCVIFSGLAFLCKGPIAIVLIGLPFLLWSSLRRNFLWLRRVPWVSATLLFLAIVTPWFVLNEIKNPGSIKYFLWNENVARYLMADYGDRYGSGHVHTHGMSWAMAIIAFFPWTLFLGWAVYKNNWRRSWGWIREDANLLFAVCWALSSPIFFTFVRQLHAMYLLPAIPGLAIVTAIFLSRSLEVSDENIHPAMAKRVVLTFLVVWIGLFLVGGLLQFSICSPTLGVLILSLALLSLGHVRHMGTALGVVTFVASICFGTYFSVLASLSPYIDSHRSAEEIMQALIRDASTDPAHIHRIGIITRNSYSPYWTANAWATELGQRVDVKYVEPRDMATSDVCHVMMKVKSLDEVPVEVTSNFDYVQRVGEWVLYRRKTIERVDFGPPLHDASS